MKINYLENPRERIERHPAPDDCWLWCDLCHRFFQYKHAEPTGWFARDACPFDDCYGYGLGFNIFWWDDTREPDDPRWPANVDELEHGMTSPEMAPFYAAQLTARIHAMVSEFAHSPEVARDLDGEPPCYLSSFLEMMSDLCWDLTEEDEHDYFDREIARELVAELPVWSKTADPSEAPRMATELRTFFAFAERTNAVACANQWRALLADMALDGVFRHKMRNDWRLRKQREAQQPQRCTCAGSQANPCRSRRRGQKHARSKSTS